MTVSSGKAMKIVRRVYDWIEAALWAGITVFVIYFLVFIIPNVPKLARQSENIRAMNNAAEDRSYCEKWGMKRGTYEHTLCTMDLREFRKKIEQDFADRIIL